MVSLAKQTTPFRVAAATLEAFLEDHADVDLGFVLPRSVHVRHTALDMLRQLYVDVPGRDYNRQVDGNPSQWSALATLVLEVCPVDRECFLDEILFRFVDPADYLDIADQVLTLVSVARLVDAIVERLAAGCDMERTNALALQPALFGSRGDPRLGLARQQRLARARAELVASESLSPTVRAALRRYALPFDRLGVRHG